MLAAGVHGLLGGSSAVVTGWWRSQGGISLLCWARAAGCVLQAGRAGAYSATMHPIGRCPSARLSWDRASTLTKPQAPPQATLQSPMQPLETSQTVQLTFALWLQVCQTLTMSPCATRSLHVACGNFQRHLLCNHVPCNGLLLDGSGWAGVSPHVVKPASAMRAWVPPSLWPRLYTRNRKSPRINTLPNSSPLHLSTTPHLQLSSFCASGHRQSEPSPPDRPDPPPYSLAQRLTPVPPFCPQSRPSRPVRWIL